MTKSYTMEKTNPVFLKQLVEERGLTLVAEDMGVGKSTLSDMLTRGEARVVYERFAKAIIERRNSGRPKATIAVIRIVKAEDLAFVRRVLSSIGVKMVEFREDE